MWWPRLDHHHVTGNQACCIGATPGVGFTPEHDGTVTVGWIAEDFVEQDREAVEVANVQWAKVVVEGVVEEGVIDGEVDGLWSRA